MENPDADQRPQVATAGEALIDLVGQGDAYVPCAGGAVYNFTRALALQGVPTAYLNPLSADRFGDQLMRGLAHAGVAAVAPRRATQPTSLAVVAVDDDGRPAYSFYRQGVADRAVDAAQLHRATAALDGLRAVCTGCLALAPADATTYLPWLRAARERGLLVVVDANLRPSAEPDPSAYRSNVLAALAVADVIKVSDEDLAALFTPDDDPLAAARGLFRLGAAACVALTRGPDGAILMARDGRIWAARDNASLRIGDTVGAGDSFLAGLVGGLLSDEALDVRRGLSDATARRALARAVASASACVEQVGCVPPTRAELDARIARGTIAIAFSDAVA